MHLLLHVGGIIRCSHSPRQSRKKKKQAQQQRLPHRNTSFEEFLIK